MKRAADAKLAKSQQINCNGQPGKSRQQSVEEGLGILRMPNQPFSKINQTAILQPACIFGFFSPRRRIARITSTPSSISKQFSNALHSEHDREEFLR